MNGHPVFIDLSGIGKLFSGLPVLTDIDLQVTPGTVHAIVGENGAGKSTLGKIMGGVYRADAGTIRVNGELVKFRAPADALAQGITVMQQEIALAPDLSVIDNIMMGREKHRSGFLDRDAARREFAALLESSGFDLPRDAKAGDLPLAVQQQVEILRSLARNAKLIIMDEPTAALPAEAARRLFEVIRMVTARGVAVIFVSHFLEETLQISDMVTVLRNGRLVETAPVAGMTVGRMIEGMLGRSLASSYPKLPANDRQLAPRLVVKDIADGGRVRDASLEVRAGEIVGIFGLVGSGRSELAHAMFGASPVLAGDMTIDGSAYRPRTPAEGLRRGVSLLPESRKDQGLFLDHNERQNTVAGGLDQASQFGFVRRGREGQKAREMLRSCAVDSPQLDKIVSSLSGGNQQKVLLAKTIYRDPTIMILDEPTRGVDVGARRSIYETIIAMVRRGLAVILISSDIEEVQQMSHRLYVMREGKTVAEFPSESTSHREILNAAFGLAATDLAPMEAV
jgi:simple sugar transport system ATP-binding protein/ribose transport system ATP-binding protein